MLISNRSSFLINKRFSLFLFVPIAISILAAFMFHYLIHAYMVDQTKKQVQNVLVSNMGFHQYLQSVLHPAFFEAVEKGYISKDYYDPKFLSSSYIIRNMHDFSNEERGRRKMPQVYYKMAANNPRNPLNKADEHESKLIKLFNENRNITEYEEIVSVSGKFFYITPYRSCRTTSAA